MGKQLRVGVKLQYWLVDMGGGFTEPVTGPVVELEQIASLPMLALWDGHGRRALAGRRPPALRDS